MMGLQPRAWAAALFFLFLFLGGSGALFQLYRTDLELNEQHIRDLNLERSLAVRIDALRGSGNANETHSMVAATSTLALAMLDARIRDSAASQGAIVMETEPSNKDVESADRRVSLAATITGRITDIQGLLYAMETENPPIDVLDVSIEPMRDNPGVDQNPVLKLRLQSAANWTAR